jgi:methyl-accepting chemotaxis protein
MVLVHASAVILEVVAILMYWYFAEASEREAQQIRDQVEAQRREADLVQAGAAEREVAAERARAEEHARARESLSRDARRIRERAEETVGAIAALDNQAATLRRSVQEIAARAHQAAGTASSGQQTADSTAEEVRQLRQP